MNAPGWLSFVFSFALVLALLGGVLYLLKKMQSGSLPGLPKRRMRVIEQMSVAPRQKIVLVRVRDQELLIGITQQQINTLASFPASPEESASEDDTPTAPLAKRFADLLSAARQQNKPNNQS